MTPSRNLAGRLSAAAPSESSTPPGASDRRSAAEEPEGIDWHRVAGALGRFKWLVALVTVIGTGAGVGATRFLDPVYVAQATIWIDEADRRGPEPGPIRSGQLLQPVSWADLLESYVVLDAVVRERRLYLAPASRDDGALLGGFALAEQYRAGTYRLGLGSGEAYTLSTQDGIVVERGTLGDSIGVKLGFVWAPASGSLEPGTAVEFSVLTLRDAARRLAEQLQVTMDLNGNFLRLELRGAVPVRIAGIVNAVAQRFVEVAADLKRRKATELSGILEEQLRTARDNLTQAEATLERFRVQTITLPSEHAGRDVPVQGGEGIGGGGAGTGADNPVLARYFTEQFERDGLRHDREAIARIVASAREGGLNADALSAVGAVQEANALSAALKDLTTKQAELRGLRARYADEHPSVRRLEDDIATLERRTIPALANALVADLGAREADLDRRLAAAARDLRSVPTRALEEARLRRAVEIAATLATTLERRRDEARLAEASAMPDVRILDPAVVPREPVKNTAPRVILFAVVVSLGLGGVGAVLLDRVDPRVRYPEQVSRDMGLGILGAVPHLKRDRAGEPISPEAATEVVEALRGVRMNLLHMLRESRPLALTLTSPGPGDGKSFLTANLALAFAEAGHRTLLVDGDIRRGAQHRRFAVPRRPGLSDFLADQRPVGAIVRETRYGPLHVIACGTRTHEAPELLGSARMETLLRDLAPSYDVILCDSPPLAAAVDAYLLGTLTGNVLLAVRTGQSHREMARVKLEALARLPVRLLGAVLNDVPAGGHHSYYAYSYYLPGYEAEDETAGNPSMHRVI